MRIAIFTVGLVACSSAWSQCVGGDAFKICTDSSGNTYNVSKFGNTTMVDGYNPQTGSSWNQQSNTIGNTTFTNGTAANGQTWDSTTHSYGNGNSTTYGTDSHGRAFTYQCGRYGCY